MAKYRQLHTSFWDDPMVLELTPEQKYFYIYLLTNPNVKQCGIYEISIRQIIYHTGYNYDTVEKLLDFFIKKEKVVYSKDTNEIAICNFLKYNYSESPTVKKCIIKDLKCVKNKDLIEYIYNIDSIDIEYINNNKNKNSNNNNNNNNNNIKKRISDFEKSVLLYNDFKSISKEFISYWSELNISKTKMKFELEKTWDLKRRLERWSNNSKNFSKKDTMPDYYDKAYANRIAQDQTKQKQYREHLLSLGYEQKYSYNGEPTWKRS